MTISTDTNSPWYNNSSSIKSVVIKNGVTSIGDSAFSRCSNLTNITIPNSVTSIEEFAFSYCSQLKDVYYSGMKGEWKNIKIDNCNDNLISATIHYNSADPSPEIPPEQQISYKITNSNIATENGTVTISTSNAISGDVVTINTNPNRGTD